MGENFLKHKKREDDELAFLDTLYTNDSGSSKLEGRFYLVDAGYANTPSFIAPYQMLGTICRNKLEAGRGHKLHKNY
jgi:hypothetical protein